MKYPSNAPVLHNRYFHDSHLTFHYVFTHSDNDNCRVDLRSKTPNETKGEFRLGILFLLIQRNGCQRSMDDREISKSSRHKIFT